MTGESRTERSRRLRRDSTDAEMKLWLAIKDRRIEGLKFRRQHAFGNFVLDFYCPEAALIIEVDGGQRAELMAERDAWRTVQLQQRGLMVLRFWNNEVLENLEGVIARDHRGSDGETRSKALSSEMRRGLGEEVSKPGSALNDPGHSRWPLTQPSPRVRGEGF